MPILESSAQVVVSVVVNAPKISFGPITTMQEMTSSVCSGIVTGTEGTLTDTRDGTIYHVGKMLDGKCWMLQNLALGSTTGTMSLTSSNSNVTSNWTLPKVYTSATSGSKDNTGTAVWNFGKWVLATPLLMAGCGDTSEYYPNLASCTKVGFVDVSDSSKFEPIYTAATGSWNGANATNDTLVAVNCTSWSGSGASKICTAGAYDAHYLVGNYYQWNAATAGTGGTITDKNATGSVCPKGWKLPTSSASDVGSFGGLLSKYGVMYSLSGTVNGITYNIAGNPLSFARGGFVYAGNFVERAGWFGYYWSSRAGSGADAAYGLAFGDSSVVPSDYYSRYSGFSVRCIAE